MSSISALSFAASCSFADWSHNSIHRSLVFPNIKESVTTQGVVWNTTKVPFLHSVGASGGWTLGCFFGSGRARLLWSLYANRDMSDSGRYEVNIENRTVIKTIVEFLRLATLGRDAYFLLPPRSPASVGAKFR